MIKQKPYYTRRGYVRIGSAFPFFVKASWPFGNVKLYRDHIVISAMLRTVSAKYSEIEKVQVIKNKAVRFFLKKGKPEHAWLINYFTENTKLLRYLERHGVRIEHYKK